jgi:hypothetical protein
VDADVTNSGWALMVIAAATAQCCAQLCGRKVSNC